MNWIEYLREGVSAAVAALVAALVALIGWLFRTVFTNQRQIAIQQMKLDLLHSDLASRVVMHAEERKEIKSDIEEVKTSVRRIEDVLIKGGRHEPDAR
jgi:hypothetical protein